MCWANSPLTASMKINQLSLTTRGAMSHCWIFLVQTGGSKLGSLLTAHTTNFLPRHLETLTHSYKNNF